MPSPVAWHGADLKHVELSVRELDSILATSGKEKARAELDAVAFPAVESLTLDNGKILTHPVFAGYFQDLPNLSHLTIRFAPETKEMIGILAGAGWWRQLRFLSLVLVGGLRGLDSWGPLWNQPGLMLEELELGIVVTRHAIDVVNGNLPKLRVLALYGQAYDEFVPALLKASLPALTDLDLRRTDIDVASIRLLTRSPRQGLPNLKRLGLSVNSGREEQYTDWNGAVVWRGEEKMSDSEIYLGFLVGTGLTLIS